MAKAQSRIFFHCNTEGVRGLLARYYRPNGKNIHRGKDATEEDEWGVTLDDGLVVERMKTPSMTWQSVGGHPIHRLPTLNGSNSMTPETKSGSNDETGPDPLKAGQPSSNGRIKPGLETA